VNALRLLYIVPAFLLGLGFFVGLISVLSIPFIRRWAMRHVDVVSKRLKEVQEQKERLAQREPTPLALWLLDDARKRAN